MDLEGGGVAMESVKRGWTKPGGGGGGVEDGE